MRDYWLELNASMVDPDLLMFGGVEAHLLLRGERVLHSLTDI